MPQSTMISCISPNTDGRKIRVRVGHIWEAINKKTNTLLHTNVIFLDEQDNHILATVRNNQKQIFLPLLKEHGVYSICNFKVVPGPMLYRSVDRDLAISFFYKTKIEQKLDMDRIPRYKFELQTFDRVKNLVGQVKCLIDVIGMVLSYGQLEKRSNGAEKMDVVLINERSESMVITLWEDKARQFLELLTPSKDGPVFLVINGLLAKKFSGAASLSSTDGSRCYVNIDYVPLNDLKDALIAASKEKQEPLLAPTVEQFISSNGDTVQELPITSILATVILAGAQVVRCICHAKVAAILDGNGWYYHCCPTWPRTLRDLDGKFYCLACEEETQTLAQRFRIVVQVENQTGSSVTLFNREAEQLVGVPLQKLLADQGEVAAIPSAVNNIIGKVCAFQLKITPYNIIQGCEEYTVTRVSEITDITSHTHMLSDHAGIGTLVDDSHVNKKQKIA